jgi:hypothetical protein
MMCPYWTSLVMPRGRRYRARMVLGASSIAIGGFTRKGKQWLTYHRL